MPEDRPPEVAFVPLADELGRHASWPYVHQMRVLGIPVVCQSNSRDVCDQFAEAFSVCRHEPGGAPGEPTLTVRIAIMPWPHDASSPPIVRAFALDGAKLLLHSPGSVAEIDPDRGAAVAFASASFAADRAGFTRQLLESMTFALLTHYDRHPLHASAIVHGDRAVLLTGPSGAGKSTLAHVAHAAGLQVLSEDTVWIQQQPEFRVWGLPRMVYLRDPEGPGKRAVPLTTALEAAPCSASTPVVCLLERGQHTPQLERLDAGAVAAALSRDVAAGFDRYPERHRSVVRRLAEPGGWRLRLTDDATAAVPLLRQMVHAKAT